MVSEQGVGGAPAFRVDHAAYRTGYAKLLAIYHQVDAARKRIDDAAAQIRAEQVSTLIAGVTVGATGSVRAVGGDARYLGSTFSVTPGLTTALGALQAELADTLQKMHDSYVAYLDTDQESAFALIKSAQSDP